ARRARDGSRPRRRRSARHDALLRALRRDRGTADRRVGAGRGGALHTAPHSGESVRVAVVDCTGHRKAPDAHGELILVNPVIVAAEGSEVGREGCLRIPELTANVRRATAIAVEAEGVRVEAEGFEARVL